MFRLPEKEEEMGNRQEVYVPRMTQHHIICPHCTVIIKIFKSGRGITFTQCSICRIHDHKTGIRDWRHRFHLPESYSLEVVVE